MFERFTDKARKTMALAGEEAKALNHEYIGTEHILLALVDPNTEGVATEVFLRLGADWRTVRRCVHNLVKPGPSDTVTLSKLPLTPRSKRVVEFAMNEMLRFEDQHCGTEHLLLGLLSEVDGIGATVLRKNFGIVADKVSEIISAMSESDREAEERLML